MATVQLIFRKREVKSHSLSKRERIFTLEKNSWYGHGEEDQMMKNKEILI